MSPLNTAESGQESGADNTLEFDNAPQFDNSYGQQLSGFYTYLQPTPLKGARLFYHSEPLAQELGLDASWFSTPKSAVWAGERLLPGMEPLAQVYSGHQFGVWAGQKPVIPDYEWITYGELVNEDQQDLVAIKIGITKQDGNVRKNFTDSFSIYHHKSYFEVRMEYDLAARIEKRIKKELPVGFLSKAEMNDGYTETAAPDQLSEMMRIFEEEIATTQKPFLRVM